MRWDWSDWLIGGLLALIVALIPLMVYAMYQERKQWDAFAAEHHCKVVVKKQGGVSTGFGPAVIGGQAGVIVTTTQDPNQTAYLCDDGITYWRND